MCGIAGFSLTPESKVNPRKLASALLCQIEKRGNQAAGYAWQTRHETGVYKKDTTGSKLSTWHMPRKTRTAILHTRMATHGTIRDMANNHPVMSPNGNIALVHNGVIYNHDRVRTELPYQLPEVDTSVIPAILQKYGLERFDMLDGDAAVAWLDNRTPGKLNLARVSHSPLWIANLTKDGSFVFASTELLLCNALDSLGLDYEWVVEVPEYTIYKIVDGIITDFGKLPETAPEYEDKLVYNPNYYRNITSGGNSWNNWTEPTPWYTEDEVELEDVRNFNDYKSYFHQVGDEYFDENGIYIGTEETLMEDYEEWRYLKTLERNERKRENEAWGRMDDIWY